MLIQIHITHTTGPCLITLLYYFMKLTSSECQIISVVHKEMVLKVQGIFLTDVMNNATEPRKVCFFSIRVIFTWVGSGGCNCLVSWFCYQLIAKPGNKTVAPPWPNTHPFEVITYIIHSSSSKQLQQAIRLCDQYVVVTMYYVSTLKKYDMDLRSMAKAKSFIPAKNNTGYYMPKE